MFALQPNKGKNIELPVNFLKINKVHLPADLNNP